MKNLLIDLSGGKAKALKMDAAISFMPFVRFLEQRIQEERTLKTSFYQTILDFFYAKEIPREEIQLTEAHRYDDFCEYIYASLSPALYPEQNLAWGLSAPLRPEIFYGTDLLYAILERKRSDAETDTPHKAPEQYKKERMHAIYALVLQRLYNFEIPVKIEQYHAWTHPETGLLRYNQVHINVDFIEVMPLGELPALSFRELYTYFSEPDGHEQLEKILPLSLFQLRGFAVVTVTDVTPQTAVENIRQIRFQRSKGNTADHYQDVIRSLKTLVQNNRVEFDLFPFVRVNDQAVYGYEKAGNGILFSVWGEHTLSPEAFRKQAEGYAANPVSFFSPDIHGESELQIGFLDAFRSAGVRSLVLIPLFYNKILVGVLGMHTWLEEQFDEKTLAMLDPALGPLSQLLQIYIDEFNTELDQIIKEKFTSIQPAVQWKFNEAAWHYLHQKKKNLPAAMENIYFSEVYPLYGAVDIRNSTLERNAAIKADLDHHLVLLGNTLAALRPFDPSSLMEEISYHCRKWHERLQSDALDSNEENNLSHFLNGQARDYLMHLFRQKADTGAIIDKYLQAIDPEQGTVHRHRLALEQSMQLINQAVNNYFETGKEQLQQSYPCYFEKFRTDGIEYDIYIGQAIAPEKPFDLFHLKNLRLWQLSSMAEVARLSHSLQLKMSKPLLTTQLIFVHNQPIDISFRTDERKFDVEGAYNIRYQMIKKRIDKVHIRHTQERLTQPGTIAVIYFHERDVADYRPYISYLQETGVLAQQMEALELEDLQGLSGLKALRIGILYPDANDA